MLGLALLLVLFLLPQSTRSITTNKAFIAVSANNSLLIQPPQGGFVSIVNFTELSSTISTLSSALVGMTSTETELSSTKSELSSALVRVTSIDTELSSTKTDLSSTKTELARMNGTDELLFSALSAALSRISSLESSTAIATAQSPCKI